VCIIIAHGGVESEQSQAQQHALTLYIYLVAAANSEADPNSAVLNSIISDGRLDEHCMLHGGCL